MNNFVKRTLTGIIFVIVLVGSILLHPLVAFGLFAVITALGILEFYRLVDTAGISSNRAAGLLSGLAVYSAIFGYFSGWFGSSVFLVIIPLFAIVFVCELYRKKATPFQNISLTLAGTLYIAIPFALLLALGYADPATNGYNARIILGFFLLLWSSDTGAYLVGMNIGKHPLFERISPKKSWEGFIGGIVFTLLVTYLVFRWLGILSLTDWMVIAVIICIFGVWGDLIESMLKRSLQIKDSGNILPGHGGILDRFDSVLFSAPVVFFFLYGRHLLF